MTPTNPFTTAVEQARDWPVRNPWARSTFWQLCYCIALFNGFRLDLFRVNEYGPTAVAAAYWVLSTVLSFAISGAVVTALAIRAVRSRGLGAAALDINDAADALDAAHDARTRTALAFVLEFGRLWLYPFAWGFLTALLVLR